ncbi:MAG TPA: polysaccharide deacetylase family protein [Sphingomicrobium sp.]
MGKVIKHRRLGKVVIAALLLSGCANLQPGPVADLKMAITIDDLPVHGPLPRGMTPLQVNQQMIGALQEAQVPGVSVYINGKSTITHPGSELAIAAWRDAGIQIANHTWSHLNLNDVSLDFYRDEIVRNEPLLQKYAGGKDWKWFRFPFLAEGDDPTTRAAIRKFLAEHDYRIAGVSMDFSDWRFTAAYTRCKDANNASAIREMERLYMNSVRAGVDYSRAAARELYGREIPQVLLMHVGAFSAHMMPRVIAEYRKAGFRFVSIEEAQADPAYAEDNDPRLAPRPQFISARLNAKGVSLPQQPDYTPQLNAMCPGGSLISTP